MSMSYDSGPETREHIKQVARRLKAVQVELGDRAWMHDASKLGPNEKPHFDGATPKLKGLTYGSVEYKAALAELGPALAHHYKHNSHHPECWPDGIKGMDLLDLIEMYCDWAAAVTRHADGNLAKSIEINADRFSMGNELLEIFRNTFRRHGGFAGYEEEWMGSTPFPPPADDPDATWITDVASTIRRAAKPNAVVGPTHEETMATIAEKQIA
jgi:hypothetical protein